MSNTERTHYSDEELALLRQQLVRGHALARAEVAARMAAAPKCVDGGPCEMAARGLPPCVRGGRSLKSRCSIRAAKDDPHAWRRIEQLAREGNAAAAATIARAALTP
jgi:hypothetical protein